VAGRTFADRASIELLRVPNVTPPEGTTITGSEAVSVALMPSGERPTVEDDWHDASWSDDESDVEVLVGPGTDVGELAPGEYSVYVRITSAQEIPVLSCGSIRIR
jgi:hypothetical protein